MVDSAFEKVEIYKAEYESLKRDANDNRQIVKIVTIIATAVIVLILFFMIGLPQYDLWHHQQQLELERAQKIEDAKNEVVIREIEQQDLTTEEYLKWLQIKTTNRQE